MWYVYVLELERPSRLNSKQYGGRKYYVGVTQSLLQRLKVHKTGHWDSSQVVKRCGVKEVCAVYTMSNEVQAKKLEKQLAYNCSRRIPF